MYQFTAIDIRTRIKFLAYGQKKSPDIALFPPVILDNLSDSSYWKGGKDVYAHYTPNLPVKPLSLLKIYPSEIVSDPTEK